jgi:hypothetical protein
MSDLKKPELPAKPKRDPAALSSEYHRAHKQLMLWSAILFIWEFVGIDLEQAKTAEGYVGAIVKSLKSPQAVPWVLLALVVYFVMKCVLEWGQCQMERRKVPLARTDFFLALTFAASAVLLYFVQALRGIQVADIIQRSAAARAVVWGIVFGVLLALLFMVIAPRVFPTIAVWPPRNMLNSVFWGVLLIGECAIVLVGIRRLVPGNFKLGAAVFFTTLLIGIVGIIAVSKLTNRWLPKK